MGIFTRFKDIIGSNINSMLDKAEDPDKMIRLMIREMEETLVEIKAACAGSMAEAKKVGRELGEVEARAKVWEERAALAVDKSRDDLAREALVERQRLVGRVRVLEDEQSGLQALVAQAREDIGQLEDKLRAAKEKQRLLAERHTHATKRKQARAQSRRADSMDAVHRFQRYEQRIEQMEAEAEMAGSAATLEEEFRRLEGDESIEAELAALKERTGKK